jgi:hypothetical protein
VTFQGRFHFTEGNRDGHTHRRRDADRRAAELKYERRVQPNEIGVAARDGVVTLMWIPT